MPSYIQTWCNDCNSGCGRTCKKSNDSSSPWKCHDTCLRGTEKFKTLNPAASGTGQQHQLIKPLSISITGVGASSSGGSVSFNLGGAASSSNQPGWAKDGRAAWMSWYNCGSSPEKTNCCIINMPDGYSAMADNGTGTTISDPAGVHGSSAPTALSPGSYDQLLDEYMYPDDSLPAFWCESRRPLYTTGDTDTQGELTSNTSCESGDVTFRVYASFDGAPYELPAALPTLPAESKGYWPENETRIVINQSDSESLPYAYVSVLIYMAVYETGAAPTGCGSYCYSEFGPKCWRVTYRKELATACSCDVTGTYTHYSSSIAVQADAHGQNCRQAKCTGSVSALDTCTPNDDSTDGWFHQGYASYEACVGDNTSSGCLDSCSFEDYTYHTQAGCTPESDSDWSGSCCCTAASCLSGCLRTNACSTTDAAPANSIYGGGIQYVGAYPDCGGGATPEYGGLCDCSPSDSSEAAPIGGAYFPPALDRNSTYTVVPGTCVVTQRDFVAI